MKTKDKPNNNKDKDKKKYNNLWKLIEEFPFFTSDRKDKEKEFTEQRLSSCTRVKSLEDIIPWVLQSVKEKIPCQWESLWTSRWS